MGHVETLLLVGPDDLQVARLGEGTLDRVEAVGPRLCDPVVLGGGPGRVRQGLRNLMARDLGAAMAQKLRHSQHPWAVHIFPVAMERCGTHPRLALDEH